MNIRVLLFNQTTLTGGFIVALTRVARPIPLLLVLAGILMTGCSTVEPGWRGGKVPLESLKTAYVVVRPDMDKKIGDNIAEALTNHGVTASKGTLDAKPKDVAFFVEYEDHWRWDLAMYLLSLDIRFKDNASNEVIGRGAFRQGGFHSFPNAREKALAVVDSIYNAK